MQKIGSGPEKYGFDGVLVASAKQALDPWILTMMMCQDTSRVRFLGKRQTLPTFE